MKGCDDETDKVVNKSTTLLAAMGVIDVSGPKPQEECCICLNELTVDTDKYYLPLRLKNCGHVIHEHCLAELLTVRKSPLCPLCRVNMFKK